MCLPGGKSLPALQGLSARTQMGYKISRLLNYTSIQGALSEQKPLGNLSQRRIPASSWLYAKDHNSGLSLILSTVLFLGLLNHILQKLLVCFDS